MSTNNHDESKLCSVNKQSPVQGKIIQLESPRKIKKELIGVGCRENGDTSGTSSINNEKIIDGKIQMPQRPATVAGRIGNGFHDGDLLQEIVAAKFTSFTNHGASLKHDKIRLMIEDSIGEESKLHVQEIFSQVEQLKIEEKLLLYLIMPLSLTNPGGAIDPLRQPLNPLGNRYEIHQTIMWIKTHLEEDPDVSLPKQEVYDEYNLYCIRNSMKPLSTADFGKVMKQVYPRVRPRRLGTRGNSRYCYAGMRKRIKLNPPTLPDIGGNQTEDKFEENVTEEMLGAASTLIREWAENLLGLKFSTLSALARHLVDNLCVNTRSLAAVCTLCTSGDSNTSNNKDTISSPPVTLGKSTKMREAQLQLQRKLQQREQTRDQKNKEKAIDNRGGTNKNTGKKTRSNQSPQGTNFVVAQNTTTNNNGKLSLPVTAVHNNRQKKVFNNKSNVSLESNCDNIAVQTIEETLSNNNTKTLTTAPSNNRSNSQKPKSTRKRANSTVTIQSTTDNSPEKQIKIEEQQKQQQPRETSSLNRTAKIPVILANNSKTIKCKSNNEAGGRNCDIRSPEISNRTNNSNIKTNGSSKDQLKILRDKREACTIDPDSLDDYLNGGNNSQEQEEELLQYFQQSSSSSSDVEAAVADLDLSRSDKVSQLRLILEQNLKANVEIIPPDIPSQQTQTIIEKQDVVQKHNIIMPTTILNQQHVNQSGTRRRVSFETNVVEHSQDSNGITNPIPQSPNTRRRIFNFTPISPGPHSPGPINGRASKSSSANASPFVSPRNTPVPRSRSTLQPNTSRSRNTQKILSRSISCSVPYIGKTETFVVPTGGLSRSPLLTKSTEPTQISIISKRENQDTQCASFLSSDLTPQKQLLINYPSQENLQEIKNTYQKSQPADQEISELFRGNRQFVSDHLFYRSQSVPLHRMVNPALMLPISTHNLTTNYQIQTFNPSSSSSVAPTPVPSEFNDFVSIGQGDDPSFLLDDVDPNFMSDDQQFLINDKEITPENINNILDILDEDDGLHILPDQTGDDDLLPESILDPTLQKIIQSRSYPNTPLPQIPVGNYPSFHQLDSTGSRSYPTTPLQTVQSQEVYRESNEPMLSSPTLSSLNLNNDNVAVTNSDNVCRNVADLLETSFLTDTDGETGDLDPLSNFDGLQDVDSLTPLFNEVNDNTR